MLRPFWRYYGGKWRVAPRYPSPCFPTIVEPFAGAAGYSLRYPDRSVVLVEAYPVVAEVWRFLTRASPAEILRVPCVEHVDDLPSWVPEGARHLVGFSLNNAVTRPCKSMSIGRRQMLERGRRREGWNEAQRELVASQVSAIRHWEIVEGDWTSAPFSRDATWFVDPPYDNRAGSHYVHGPEGVDYAELGRHCREVMRGQVIACEQEGATWLPFEPFRTLKPGIFQGGQTEGSREVVWVKEPEGLSQFG